MKKIYLLWFNFGDSSKFKDIDLNTKYYLGSAFIVEADNKKDAMETLKTFYRKANTLECYINILDNLEIDELGLSKYNSKRSDVIFVQECGNINEYPGDNRLAQINPMSA